MHFDILNRLGVIHECDRRTDRQTDKTGVIAIAHWNRLRLRLAKVSSYSQIWRSTFLLHTAYSTMTVYTLLSTYFAGQPELWSRPNGRSGGGASQVMWPVLCRWWRQLATRVATVCDVTAYAVISLDYSDVLIAKCINIDTYYIRLITCNNKCIKQNCRLIVKCTRCCISCRYSVLIWIHLCIFM